MPFFSKERLTEWEQNGYIIVKAKDIFSKKDLENVLIYSDELQKWPETPGKWMQYFETSSLDGSRILRRVENFLPYHEGLNKLFNSSPFLSLVGELFGERACLFKDKLNFKLPGAEGFAPHQDHQAGWDMYGNSLHISVSVTIDKCTLANGCLEIVPGQHKNGLLGPQLAELPKEVVDRLTWVPVPSEPGDMVFFDSFVPHRSGPNVTSDSRRVLYLTYNKAAEGDFCERYFADKRLSYPPDIERLPGKKYEYKI